MRSEIVVGSNPPAASKCNVGAKMIVGAVSALGYQVFLGRLLSILLCVSIIEKNVKD